MPVIQDDMISRQVTRKDMLPLSFLKKSAYTGSKRGLRYKLEKTETQIGGEVPGEAEAGTEPEKRTVLRVYAWTGKLAFDNTPEEEMSIRDVEFSDAGIDEAIAYLNERLGEL